MLYLHQISQLPSIKEMQVEHSVKVRDGKDVWTFNTLRPKPKYNSYLDFQREQLVRKNGKVYAKFVLNQGPYMEACRVKIDPGYPVVAVRAAFGIGSHWDTMLFAIKNGELRKMGRPPAENSHGPVLWNGRKDVWEFDNFDLDESRHDPGYRPGYVLMRVDRKFRLQVFKFIPDRRPKVPTTILTPDLR